MAIYSLAQRCINTSVDTCAWEIRTASTDRPRLYELGVSQTNGNACFLGLGRSSAIGTSPTLPATFIAEDTSDPVGTVIGAVAWASGPSAPTNYLRRLHVPALTGSTTIITFPRGLLIPVSASLVLWNIVSNGLCDVWAVIEE